MIKIQKPQTGEYNPHALPYINLLPDDGKIIKHLADNFKKTKSFILSVPSEKFDTDTHRVT